MMRVSTAPRFEDRPWRWPWVAVAVAISATLLLGWFLRITGGPTTAAAKIPDGWRRYHAVDGAYTVVGPAAPSVAVQNTDLGLQRTVRFTAPQGEILGVESVDLLANVATGATEHELVAAWSNRLLGSLNGVIDEQDVLRAGAHPGVALHIEQGGQRIVVRVFAAGRHLYEVAAVLPAGTSDADRAAAESFVRSFALTG
jgi:hypothetical protein